MDRMKRSAATPSGMREPRNKETRRELADQLRDLRTKADRSLQHRVDLSDQRERLRALGYVVDGPLDEPTPSSDTDTEREWP